MATSKKSDNNSSFNVIHSIYYYVVIAGCVLALSIATFILLRRILIDTALPQLRQDANFYYEPTRDSLRFNYPECNPDSQNYDSEECDQILQEQKEQEENRSQQRYEQTRAEQYVYSILAMVIAAIVSSVHIIYFRPSNKMN